MFKGNMSKLLKQAQSVQQEIEKVQNQLSDMIIEGESGGGMVKVKVNGKQEVLELNIDETTMEEDKEVIEDLIVSALNKALSKAQIENLFLLPSELKVNSSHTFYLQKFDENENKIIQELLPRKVLNQVIKKFSMEYTRRKY